jgi:hypothetical protein
MRRPRNCLSFLILLLVVGGLNYTAVRVRAAGRWAPDARVLGYLDDTFTPFLVAGRDQTVHVFASQWINNGDLRQAVVYRQWSLSGGWTRPIDIILAPSGNAQILGAFLDSSDRMHVIFMTEGFDSTAVNYSFAPAENAYLATAWSVPEIVGDNISLASAAITGDEQGNLIIIYSGRGLGNGVYFVSSANRGASWSKPSPVFVTHDTELVPFSLRLAMGPDHQVRAAWNVVSSRGEDEALYFANYSISESAWSIPVQLDHRIDLPSYFGPSYPALVDTGTNVLILYNGGNPYAGGYVDPGRPVMRAASSGNGGLTWDGPFNPFPLLNGRSGEHALVVDSTGTAHGVFIMRIDQQVNGEYRPIGGIWHSSFLHNNWATPDRFISTYSPHDIRAVVSQGNVLLAVWREDPGEGKHGVWFSYTLLDAPELAVTPLPTTAAATPTQQIVITIPLENTPTALPENDALDDPAPSRWQSYPAFPLMVAAIPVSLVVIGVLVSYRLLNNRHK